MIEIFILIAFGRKLGRLARANGQKAGRYQFVLVMLWIAGECGGAILGAIIELVISRGHSPIPEKQHANNSPGEMDLCCVLPYNARN